MTSKTLHGLCPKNFSHRFIEKSMISEYEEKKIIEICKFPKLCLSMQKEVFASLVSKIGMIFMATSENKSHLLISKQELESAFRACKSTTRPLESSKFILLAILSQVTVAICCF